ncbi:MAG: Na+ dependent nucleoside transporter N-terminal domain-containing protein, partial [Polyangiaceae bacterium]
MLKASEKRSPSRLVHDWFRWVTKLRGPAAFLLLTVGLSLPMVGVYARWANAQEPTTSASVAPAASGPSTGTPPNEAKKNEETRPSGPVVDATKLRPHTTTVAERARSGVGLLVMLGICFLISRDRKKIDWRLVAIGTSLQIVFALLILGSPVGRSA